MGFFDFLKSKKKEDNVSSFGKIDSNNKGLSFEEAKQAREAFLTMLDTSEPKSKLVNAASGMLLNKNFDGAIEAYQKIAEKYPEAAADCESQIGAAWYFKGDYKKAIEGYVAALNKGADKGMMDDNIWEAAEALYKADGNKEHLQNYLSIFPEGQYAKQARKALG
ncbi:MAG: hypothetical protein U0V74_01590 [Chitinophagales bacterium]